MLTTLVLLAGFALAVIGCLDIWKSSLSLVEKILFMILLIATSWVGILVHFLYGKKHLK